MILTVEYRGQDHQVFVSDDLYDFLKTDEEQLNKYILHTLQNKISESTKSQLQDTYEACPKEVLDEQTFGYENEHYEHTVDDNISNNEDAEPVLNTDKSTTEMPEVEAETFNSSNTDRWPKNYTLVLIDAFEKNKHMFSSTTIRKEKVWQAIAKHLKSVGIGKTATQCDNKWKNLRKLYLKRQQNKKATSSGQSAIHFEYEEEFDKIYKKEPSINPVALAGNLIMEATVEKQRDNNDTEDMPKEKKRKTDSISSMQLLMEKKRETVKRDILN